jgi:macrodomain Ter protein organizer (MatP/YcbG family)
MINDKDYHHARAYLSDRLRRYTINVDERSRNAFFKIEDAEKLSKWIEKNLGVDDIERMRTAIRQRRMRANRTDLRGIAISAKAHELLVEIANRDGVTFSDVLEDVLKRQANSARRIKPRVGS